MPPASDSYRLIRPIATGGMAEVYLAEATGADGQKRPVAIKRVLPELSDQRGMVAMLRDEGRLGVHLKHPNLVSVLEYNDRSATPFLVMEHVDGPDLLRLGQALADRGERFSVAETVEVGIQVCQGLQFAHQLRDEAGEAMGLVHRDVTPGNVLIDHKGRARLCDFGLAKASTQAELTAPGIIKGKYGYLSPEGAVGARVDQRADLFSLGIVLWEMLAMQRLFRGEHDYATVLLVQKAQVPPLAPRNPQVDPVLLEILDRALSRDPATRFASAQAFAHALMAYQDWRELSPDLSMLPVRGESRATLPLAPRRPRQERSPENRTQA